MWGAGSGSVLDAVGIQEYLMPGYAGKHLSGRSKDKTKAKGISNEEAEVTCISHSSGQGEGRAMAMSGLWMFICRLFFFFTPLRQSLTLYPRPAPSLWQSSCPKC